MLSKVPSWYFGTNSSVFQDVQEKLIYRVWTSGFLNLQAPCFQIYPDHIVPKALTDWDIKLARLSCRHAIHKLSQNLFTRTSTSHQFAVSLEEFRSRSPMSQVEMYIRDSIKGCRHRPLLTSLGFYQWEIYQEMYNVDFPLIKKHFPFLLVCWFYWGSGIEIFRTCILEQFRKSWTSSIYPVGHVLNKGWQL